MRYTAENLLRRARLPPPEPGVVNRVTPADAGWSMLGVEVRRMRAGEAWSHQTDEAEAVLVLLGGRCDVRSDQGRWPELGGRAHVFDGMPHAVYLPRRTRFTVRALTEGLELAYGWAPCDQDHPARVVTPADSKIELRGGGAATRQINSIVPPGFDCQRLVCVEVYTPGGNWSSYPPHKHDVHVPDGQGGVREADLEEVYFFQMRRPEGYAFQRIYTDDRSIDAAVAPGHNDLVLVPAGYHPVGAAHGYDCYYLNFLAGSAQSLANTDDPAHAWVKQTWGPKDPRVPMVTHEGPRTP